MGHLVTCQLDNPTFWGPVSWTTCQKSDLSAGQPALLSTCQLDNLPKKWSVSWTTCHLSVGQPAFCRDLSAGQPAFTASA